MEWREIESESMAKFDSVGSSFRLQTEIRVRNFYDLDDEREEEDDGSRPENPVSMSEEKELIDAVNMLLTLVNGDFGPEPVNNFRGKVDESETMSSDSLTHGGTGENSKGKGISKRGFNTRKSGIFVRSHKSDNQTVDKKKRSD
ncbi:Hypothetical predicted protein [Olea europaea subsp. europaea]|uniref:Uncharacterized protein n=1 Tax=Olea europaea subsp. europaea TaxID=158383 RepID=A0A8S0UPI8_OLEEU|nr:Hypothetical predicted protein [Olea europaea subsp. europaea]